MIGLSTERSPSPKVVTPHFIAGAIGFLTLSILAVISSEALLIHFYSWQILTMVHIAALSWGTIIIMGTLYQLIPVVFETKLFSEKLAIFNFWLFVISISLFAYSFWFNKLLDWMPITSSLIFVSVWIFTINIILSYRSAEKKDISSKFIIAAIFWLMMTSLFGLLLAFNYKYGFLDNSNFRFLKIHAHFGIVGWFLQLIMGVGATLVPMFLVSHNLKKEKLVRTFYLLNIGLIGLYLDWQFLKGSYLMPIYWIMISLSVIQYLSYIHDSYKSKLRKLDIGMKHTMFAFILIIIPILLPVIILFVPYADNSIFKNVIVLYGISIFLGFFTNMILGQTYKTIPFIIWLHRYQKYVGKAKTPFPRELYNQRIADIQFYIYILTLLFLVIGLIINSILFVKTGAVLLLITAILYNINVFKIVFDKKKLELNENID